MSETSIQAHQTSSHQQPKYALRLAAEEDAQLLAEILADAFLEDPVLRWVFTDPSFDERFLLQDVAQADIPAQHCWLESAGRGAACWQPPSSRPRKPGWLRMVRVLFPMLIKLGLKPMRRGELVENAFASNRPKEPHYYLHMLGARQQFQGQGVGSALLKQGLRVVDDHKMPAYLESSNIANVRLYERFGFTTINSARLAEDGPTVWYMWRDAVKSNT